MMNNITPRIKKNYGKLMYSPSKVSIYFRLSILTIAAIVVTFGVDLFIHKAGIYTGGLRGVQLIILYGIKDMKPWVSYLIFFGMNLPLAYIGWKYIGHKFTLLTFYFLLIQALISYVINLPEIYQKLEGVYEINNDNNDKYIISVIGAIIYGFGVGLTFVSGASTGGTKFIVAYILKKFKVSLGKTSIYIAIFVIALGLTINDIILDHKDVWESIFSIKIFASIIFVIIQGIVSNYIAPKTMKTKIEIQSSNYNAVKKVVLGSILDTRTWYTYKIKKNSEAKESKVFVLIIDRMEKLYVIKKLSKLLPNSMISAHDISGSIKEFKVRNFD